MWVEKLVEKRIIQERKELLRGFGLFKAVVCSLLRKELFFKIFSFV